MTGKYKLTFSYIFGGLLVVCAVVLAGSLTPSVDTNTANFYTLEDIYQKLSDNAYTATSSDHTVTTSAAPTAETMHTLADIWNKIPTLTADTIIASTTIMGVAGTYDVSNLSEDNVANGITYGTSSVGALEGAPVALEWSSSGANLNWNDAVSYCSGLAGGWRLPTEMELLTEMAKQFTPGGSDQGFTTFHIYWSSDQASPNSWIVNFPGAGYLGSNVQSQSNTGDARCVR